MTPAVHETPLSYEYRRHIASPDISTCHATGLSLPFSDNQCKTAYKYSHRKLYFECFDSTCSLCNFRLPQILLLRGHVKQKQMDLRRSLTSGVPTMPPHTSFTRCRSQQLCKHKRGISHSKQPFPAIRKPFPIRNVPFQASSVPFPILNEPFPAVYVAFPLKITHFHIQTHHFDLKNKVFASKTATLPPTTPSTTQTRPLLLFAALDASPFDASSLTPHLSLPASHHNRFTYPTL